jgi:hypothetical protein
MPKFIDESLLAACLAIVAQSFRSSGSGARRLPGFASAMS